MTGNRCAGARVNLYGGNSGVSAGQVGAAGELVPDKGEKQTWD